MQYYKCSSAILEMDLKPSTLQVYHFLAAAADYKKRSCFYGVKTIAVKIGVSVRSVQRATKELVTKGLLKIETQFGRKGRQTSNLYTLLDNPQMHIETPVKPQKQGEKLFTINCHVKALNSQIKGTALKVYTYLESMAVSKRTCSLSVKEIALGCNVSKMSAYRAIKILAKFKIMQIKNKIAASKWGKVQHGKSEYILQEFTFSSTNVMGVLSQMSPLLTKLSYNNTYKENFHKVCLNIGTGKERNSISLERKQEETSRLIDIIRD